MGFKLPERTIVLEGFTGDFEGLEVTCNKNVPMGTYLSLEESRESGDTLSLYLTFGDEILLSWNYENDAGPIPATGASFQALPPDMAALIASKWLEEVSTVPAPLDRPSTNGVVTLVEPPLDLGSMSTPN